MNDSIHPRHTLDKDLARLSEIEEATGFVARRLIAPGLGLLFLLLAASAASIYVFGEPRAAIIILAAAIAGYLAMNIGANDVGNNVGPAVGAGAMSMVGALCMAAVFEIAGALIAGDAVVATISSGLIHSAAISDPAVLVRVMLAGLVASALWINFATWIGAPVSTTHSIVGGVIGAGAVAAGLDAVDWVSVLTIATIWILAPLAGALVAIAFLIFVKRAIVHQDDKIRAARRWIPVLTALMAGSFAAYLVTRLAADADWPLVASIGLACFGVIWITSRISVHRQSQGMDNRNRSLRFLFRLPLIGAAALLSFAHGANDVANAVGPLAAIVHAASQGEVANSVDIPLWVMVIGAFGISCGILLYGPKLITIIGSEITKLNPMRAYCVALAVAIVVIIASWFGLPVSSTHIAVGAVFGVGFFREWYNTHSAHRRAYMQRKRDLQAAAQTDAGTEENEQSGERRRKLPSHEEIRHRRLVRRAHLVTIGSAWVTTLPAAAILSALLFAVFSALA